MANATTVSTDEYRGTHIVDESKNIAWEVADFLFGAKSIKNIAEGNGTWGDAAVIGITAATFLIPPAKIALLGNKALRKVLAETITVNASTNSLPIVAKAVTKTRMEVEAELVRRGKLTYGKTLKPETSSIPMSEKRFEDITGPTPETKPVSSAAYEVTERSTPTAAAARELRREGGSLTRKKRRDVEKGFSNFTEPTEAEIGILESKNITAGTGRKSDMGPGSDPIQFVDGYLEKVAQYKTLIQQVKEAGVTRTFKKNAKELKDDEKNLTLRGEQKSLVKDPENPEGVTPLTDIMIELETLESYFKQNHKFFNKLYKDVYGNEVSGTIMSYSAVAAGKQAAVTAEEKLIARLRPRPKEVSKDRQRIDKQDEALTAAENKKPIDFEESNFQGGTKFKADSDFTPQLDPKKTSLAPSQSGRAEMDELKADLKNSMDNLRNAKTPAEQKLYAKAVEQARKIIEERSKILGFTAPRGAARQEQIDLADELFKAQDVRIALKRTSATPKGTPTTKNVADRKKHVENILAKEDKDFVKESPDFAKQIKNKPKYKNDDGTLDVEAYEKRMQEYRDELDKLRKKQAYGLDKTKELAPQLDDTGIRTFMNRVATNPIDPINRQPLIDLIDDLAEQVESPALKKRILNYVNKLKLQEGIDKGAARKAGMNTRLAKEDAARKARFEAKQAASKSEKAPKAEAPKAEAPKVEAPNASKITVHSGMADGADITWAEVASSMGIKTIGHSYKDHDRIISKTRPALETRNELTKEQLEVADKFLTQASKGLNESYNPASLTYNHVNLLRRNYYQVKNSEAVIAISILQPNLLKATGGTRWAVQMGIDKGVPTYVFDQVKKSWFKWDGKKFVDSDIPPKFKEFAGVGSRALTADGRNAIEEYMEQYVSRGTKAKVAESTVSALKPIDSFRGTNQFLSNMSESSFKVGQETYPTVEHFFQAMKTTDPTERAAILAAKTPAEAKKIGKTVTLPANWSKIKLEVMEVGLRAKFQQNPELKKKLIDTGDADLIEGNTWGDTYWGQVDGKGENNLGKLLMKIRKILMEGK